MNLFIGFTSSFFPCSTGSLRLTSKAYTNEKFLCKTDVPPTRSGGMMTHPASADFGNNYPNALIYEQKL